MRLNRTACILFFTALCLFLCGSFAVSAQEIIMEGTVYNTGDKKPVDFATVILLEARVKARTAGKGRYRLVVPQAGKYTLIIRSTGFKMLKTTIDITRSGTRDFWLQPVRITGGALTIVGERDIQKVSRYTLSVRDLKEVPASLGDSLNALTALPGVIKTAGFFGNLVIRGAPESSNRYYVDNMPLYNPQHYGGLHSVIANELMSEIDLYSSAFPAQFGGPTAAVININTLDDVREFGGWADLGLISATALVKIPLTKTVLKDENFVKENKGYVVVSGRYGYLSLVIPSFYELVMNERLNAVPEYWDYQVKVKYYFNNEHSLTLLAFGSRDYIRFTNRGGSIFEGNEFDPLFQSFSFKNDLMSFTQGVTYRFEPTKRFNNELLFYASLNDSSLYTNIDSTLAASWTKGYNNRSKPNIYGFKDTLRFKWLKDIAELRIGADIIFYDFVYKGYSFIPNEWDGYSIPDFANEYEFYLRPMDNTTLNMTIGGYVENKFAYKGLTVTPGVHLNYLERSGHFIADPRLLISYEFESETTLSLAGGLYSSFYQTNPYIFAYDQFITEIGPCLKPERAAHGTIGIEQKIFLFTIRAEGFFNYFWDVGVQDIRVQNQFDNSAEITAYGAEFLLRLDRTEKTAGFFGWINYTFTQSKYRSGLPQWIDEYGDTYIDYDYELEHALKLVLGYTFGKHTISGKFQVYTSFPYTPISDSEQSPAGSRRYVRKFTYSEPNSNRFPVAHQLDLRYTYKTPYSWGSVSWYIEIINAYNYVPVSRETWDYTKPYIKGVNPTREREEDAFGLIPNFGVEIKF